jgi:hypothetical protein
VRASARVSALALGIAAALSAAAIDGHAALAREATEAAACPGTPTAVIIDGNLYADVRGAKQRYVFGSSGRPVLSVDEALGLVKALRFTGTAGQLLDRLERSPISGATYSNDGTFSYFTVSCPGTYTATAVVRSEGGGSITGTRFWLQQGLPPHVRRAFCMPEQWVRAGALVSVTFHVPLAARAPVFAVDSDGNGKADSVGPFRPGGSAFPANDSC